MNPRRSRPHSSTNCQQDLLVFNYVMEDSYTGRVRDDVTTSLDTSSNPESSYYTPRPSTPVERSARWATGGRLQNQNGRPDGGVPQYNKGMGYSQMQRADGQVDESFEEQVYIPNEGLVNFQWSNETTADTNYGETSPCDRRSQFSTRCNGMIDPVAFHFGAQFNSHDSETYHEAAEPDPIFHSSNTLKTLERNETPQDLPNLNPPLVDTHHHLPLYEYQRPSIVLSNPVGQTIPPVADDLYCRMLGDESMTTTGVVKQVCSILHGLNQKWMGRLESSPDLYDFYVHCMPLTPSRLLETGIHVLQQCFSRTLPSSFGELFALMHVAFAFSSVIHSDGDSYYWDGFSSDLRYWHHTLKDFEEISLFARIWDRLWCPRSSINQSFMNHTRGDLYETLMEGMVIKGCKNFLDVLGHTTMAQERGLPLADDHLSVTRILEKDVMQPLTQRLAIREYWEQINDAQSRMRKGLIRDVHELELVLISRNTSSKTSSHVHSRYMKEVASQFDREMGSPDWRNDSYTTYLNIFLNLARKSPGYLASKVDYCSSGWNADSSVRTHAATPSSSTSYPSPARFLHHNESIVSPHTTNPTGVFYTTTPSDISRPTSSTYASPTNESFKPRSSPATSAGLLSTTSGPTTPTPSTTGSESGSGVTVCELCPDVIYRGSLESQRRNFNRHNEDKHHNKEKLKCPRCVATFAPGRIDNLNRHMKKFGHY